MTVIKQIVDSFDVMYHVRKSKKLQALYAKVTYIPFLPPSAVIVKKESFELFIKDSSAPNNRKNVNRYNTTRSAFWELLMHLCPC